MYSKPKRDTNKNCRKDLAKINVKNYMQNKVDYKAHLKSLLRTQFICCHKGTYV
jgi:hypothetical protein